VIPKHRHHIIPRHAGGTDDHCNLTPPISVRLHAMFHLDRWRRVGDIRDLVACKMLLGCRRADMWEWTDERKARASESQAASWDDERRAAASAALLERWHSDDDFVAAAKAGQSKPRGKLSDSHRAAISESMLGNKHAYGLRHSPETKLRISDSLKGRMLSDQARANISAAKIGDRNPMFGRPSPRRGVELSDETKQKISDAHRARRARNS
jgi:NUMOD3 motif.